LNVTDTAATVFLSWLFLTNNFLCKYMVSVACKYHIHADFTMDK